MYASEKFDSKQNKVSAFNISFGTIICILHMYFLLCMDAAPAVAMTT